MEELREQVNELRKKIYLDSSNSLVFAPSSTSTSELARSTGELARGENKQKDPAVVEILRKSFELEEKLEAWILRRRQEQKLEVLKDVKDDSQQKLKEVMDASQKKFKDVMDASQEKCKDVVDGSQLKFKQEVDVAYDRSSKKSSATSSSVSSFGSAKTELAEEMDIVEVKEEPVPFWAEMSGDELARQIDCMYMEEIKAVEEDLRSEMRSEVTWTSRREEVCHQSGIEASTFATKWWKARCPSMVNLPAPWNPNSET